MLEELAEHHSVIWYDEGAVMLQCKNTGERLLTNEGEIVQCPGCDFKLKVVADIRLYEIS